MKRRKFQTGGNPKYRQLHEVMNNTTDIDEAGELMSKILKDVPFDKKKSFYNDFTKTYPDGGRNYSLKYSDESINSMDANKFSLVPKDKPEGFEVQPVQPIGSPRRVGTTAVGRMMGKNNTRGRLFKNGGFWNDNLGNIIKGVGGAGMLAMGNPAGLGMLGTGVAGMIGNATANQEPNPNEEMNKWIINKRHNDINNTAMGRTMFKSGGRATGGNLVPMSSDEQLAVGNSHEQGGIQRPYGEIEGGEVERQTEGGTQIYSDDLGYADPAEELASMKGQLEKQYQDIATQIQAYLQHMDKINDKTNDPRVDKFERNKHKREHAKISKDYVDLQENADMIQAKIQQIDMEMEQLFAQQEQEADAMGMRDEEGMPNEEPMFATGGYSNRRMTSLGATMNINNDPELQPKSMSILDQVNDNSIGDISGTGDNFDFVKSLPFVSNVASAFLQGRNNRISPPRAQMMATPTMDPNVNVNAEIDAVRSSVASVNESLDSNVNNAAVARANRASVGIQGARAENQIHGNARNISRQTVNQNLGMAAQIGSQNQQMDFYNQQLEDAHKRQSLTAAGQNIANIESKLQQYVSQGRMDDYQKMQVELMDKVLSGSIGPELNTLLGLYKTESELTTALQAKGITTNSDKYKEVLNKWKSLNE